MKKFQQQKYLNRFIEKLFYIILLLKIIKFIYISKKNIKSNKKYIFFKIEFVYQNISLHIAN